MSTPFRLDKRAYNGAPRIRNGCTAGACEQAALRACDRWHDDRELRSRALRDRYEQGRLTRAAKKARLEKFLNDL